MKYHMIWGLLASIMMIVVPVMTIVMNSGIEKMAYGYLIAIAFYMAAIYNKMEDR